MMFVISICDDEILVLFKFVIRILEMFLFGISIFWMLIEYREYYVC